MDVTDSTLDKSEVERLERHQRLQEAGLNIPLRMVFKFSNSIEGSRWFLNFSFEIVSKGKQRD